MQGVAPKLKDFKVKEKYRKELISYVKEHGCDKLSQTKLRALLSANLIQSTGGKRIMQWRWQQFCKGETVAIGTAGKCIF